MPIEKETPALALRAITSLFDTTLQPLFAAPGAFIHACLQDVSPGAYFPHEIDGFWIESPVWRNHPARVPVNVMNLTGDVLLWMPDDKYPGGFAGIRTPGHKIVTSSPHFTFTTTGRLMFSCVHLKRIPDIALRF